MKRALSRYLIHFLVEIECVTSLLQSQLDCIKVLLLLGSVSTYLSLYFDMCRQLLCSGWFLIRPMTAFRRRPVHSVPSLVRDVEVAALPHQQADDLRVLALHRQVLRAGDEGRGSKGVHKEKKLKTISIPVKKDAL